MSFIRFLLENTSHFIDLPTAIRQATHDGYVIDGVKGIASEVELSKVPNTLQRPPMGLYLYQRGDHGEKGQITLYEPTTKKKDIKYTAPDKKTYGIVDTWYLPTQDHVDQQKADQDEKAAWDKNYREVVKPAQLAWMRKVFDAAQTKIRQGHTITVTTMTKITPVNKPEYLRFVEKQGIQMMVGRSGKFVWLSIEQANQIAHQVNVPPMSRS